MKEGLKVGVMMEEDGDVEVMEKTEEVLDESG